MFTAEDPLIVFPQTYLTFDVMCIDGQGHSVQLYYDNTAEVLRVLYLYLYVYLYMLTCTTNGILKFMYCIMYDVLHCVRLCHE